MKSVWYLILQCYISFAAIVLTVAMTLKFNHPCKLISNFIPQKWIKSEETAATKESSAQETEDEEEDEKVVDVHSEEKVRKHSESEAKETESGEDEDEDDDDVDEYDEKKLGKGKPDKRKVGRRQGSVAKEKLKVGTSPKKSSLPMTTNSPAKRSFSKRSKAEEDNDASMKVFVSKKRNLGSPKKKSTPKSNTKEKTTGMHLLHALS